MNKYEIRYVFSDGDESWSTESSIGRAEARERHGIPPEYQYIGFGVYENRPGDYKGSIEQRHVEDFPWRQGAEAFVQGLTTGPVAQALAEWASTFRDDEIPEYVKDALRGVDPF